MHPQPLYSLDLAPQGFWLFSQVQIMVKGKQFECVQETPELLQELSMLMG